MWRHTIMRRANTDPIQSDRGHPAIEKQLKRRNSWRRPTRFGLVEERIGDICAAFRHWQIELIPVGPEEHDVLRLKGPVLRFPGSDLLGQDFGTDSRTALSCQ